MLDLALTQNRPIHRISAMSEMAIDTVRQLEEHILKAHQTQIPTQHILHAGVYARTIMIPAGVVLTGALIKMATVLVVSGHCMVYVGEQSFERIGYSVFAASANRKQAFVALEDTYLTMVFATNVRNIDAAEQQFTDEYDRLSSRYNDAVNHILITGE